MMKRTLYLAVAALVVVTGWYLISVNIPTSGVEKSAEKQTNIAYPYRFAKEIKTAYTIRFIQKTIFKKSRFVPQESTMTYNLSAILHMRVLEKGKEYIWSAIELSSVNLVGTAMDKEVFNSLTPYYESMFLVKHDPKGNIEEMRFPGKIENFSGLAQMMYLMEVINLNKRTYRLEQKDSLGLYEAFYKKHLATIQKQKKQYISYTDIDGSYTVKIKKYSLKAIVDQKENWLKTLNIDEKVSLIDQKNSSDIDNINTVQLTKVSNSDIDTSLGIWQEKRNIEKILKGFEALQKTDIDIFKRLSQRRIKKDFIKNNIDLSMLTKDINANLLKIKAYIKAFPEQTYKFKNIIQHASDADSMRLIAILSLVSTPDAQSLLVDLANDTMSTHDTQIRAVIGLGGVSDPTREIVDALIGVSDIRGDESEIDRSNTALLALAAHTKITSYHDDIVNYISANYNDSTSLSDEKNTLLAMQNAGAENFLGEIEQSLHSKSTKVRKIALETLATIKDKTLRNRLLLQQLDQQEDLSLKTLIKKYLESDS